MKKYYWKYFIHVLNQLKEYHERSSSPLKFPGPNMQQLLTPSRSTWLLCRWPLTMNNILWTGSPSLVIFQKKQNKCIKWSQLLATFLFKKNYRLINTNVYITFELTVSPLVKIKDLTRSHMFSRTKLSICWNKGTWKKCVQNIICLGNKYGWFWHRYVELMA